VCVHVSYRYGGSKRWETGGWSSLFGSSGGLSPQSVDMSTFLFSNMTTNKPSESSSKEQGNPDFGCQIVLKMFVQN